MSKSGLSGVSGVYMTRSSGFVSAHRKGLEVSREHLPAAGRKNLLSLRKPQQCRSGTYDSDVLVRTNTFTRPQLYHSKRL
jgi:hypothetical protein